MIKRFSINKILKTSILLLALFIFLKFPTKKEYTLKTKTVSKENTYHEIFLLDKNNYLSKTTIVVDNVKPLELSKELVNDLKCLDENKNKILNGFMCVIPANLNIDIKLENNKAIVNFSKEFNNYTDTKKEIITESVVYTLTSINELKTVSILVENEPYKENLNRKYGINKKYYFTSLNDIDYVTVYYVNKELDNTYYIPVTKYTNNNSDKIKVIIDELSSKTSYETNLMSYLNYETKLISYEMDDSGINLYFDEYLFDNIDNKKVLEEVIYSISYSIEDTLDVSNIHFFVNNEEI